MNKLKNSRLFRFLAIVLLINIFYLNSFSVFAQTINIINPVTNQIFSLKETNFIIEGTTLDDAGDISTVEYWFSDRANTQTSPRHFAKSYESSNVTDYFGLKVIPDETLKSELETLKVHLGSSNPDETYNARLWIEISDNHGGSTQDYVDIKILYNLKPELNITTASGQKKSSNTGFNTITIEGAVSDADDGDRNYIKYRIENSDSGSIAVTDTFLTLTNETGTDGTGEYILADTTDISFTSDPIDLSYINDGNYNFIVYAIDDKGGKSTEIPITFMMDKTGPEVTSIDILDSDITSSSIKFTTTVNNVSKNGSMADLNSLPYAYKISGQTNYLPWTDINSHEFTGLNQNTQYTIYVQARDIVDNKTESSVQKYTRALEPINITYTNIADTSLTINWQHNGNPEADTKYEVSRKISGANDSTYVVLKDDVIGTSYDDIGLVEGETYIYRVLAINGDGLKTVNTTGQSVLTLPSVPSIKEATAIKDSNNTKTITIKWDPVSGATKYALYATEEGGSEVLLSDTITANEYIHSNLVPNKKYEYTLVAGNDTGFSAKSSPVARYTQALDVLGLTVTQSLNESVTFSINSNTSNFSNPHTRIEIRKKSDNSLVAFSDYNVSVSDRAIGGLTQGEEYQVYIIIKNNDVPGEEIVNDEILVFDSFYTNRPVTLEALTVSEGNHHRGRPLEVTIESRENDLNDEIKAMYSITGLLEHQEKQIISPALLGSGYNYIHNTPIKEFIGKIDIPDTFESGIYEINFWLEDRAGNKTGTIKKTFRVDQTDYYLDDLDNIVKNGTNDELKDAIKFIISPDDELYYPSEIHDGILENEYLDLLRRALEERRNELGRDLSADEIKQAVALVNINTKISLNKQNTITDKEIRLVLLGNEDLYNPNYLSDYQDYLKIAYDEKGGDILRLKIPDVIKVIKFVNFIRKDRSNLTIEEIREIVDGAVPVYDEYLQGYRDALKELNERPTIEEIIEAVKLININKKIENGTITISDLKTLPPDTEIIQDYLSEYIKYLQMYQNDLARDLTVDEIKNIIESVNAVMEYETNKTSNNYTDANNNIDSLADANTKRELLSRIAKLEDPKIDFAVNDVSYDISNDKDIATISSLDKLSPSSRNSFIQFLEGKINSITINYLGNKTILVRNGKVKIKIINIDGAKEFRFIEMNEFKNENQDWQRIKDGKIEENISFSQEGFFSGGVQLRNSAGTKSNVVNIDFIVDWVSPTGKMEKYIPMQSATREDSIKIKLNVKDNFNTKKFSKINGIWDIMSTDYFDYELHGEAGLKVIKVEVSDMCGNKTTLKEPIWKVAK